MKVNFIHIACLILLTSCVDMPVDYFEETSKDKKVSDLDFLPKEIDTLSQDFEKKDTVKQHHNQKEIDFSQYQSPFKLVEKADGASCWYYDIVDAKGKVVELNDELDEALNCPSLLDLHEGDFLVYQNKNEVKYMQLTTGESFVVFQLFDGIDGVSQPVWYNKEQLLFVIVNQEKKGGYKTFTRLLVADVSNPSDIKKMKYDRMVNFSCGSICSSEPNNDFGFYNKETIWYKRNENLENGAGAIKMIDLKENNYVNHDQISTLIDGELTKEKLKFIELINPEQILWQKEIDLGVGGPREDKLIEYTESAVFGVYVYQTIAEHGRGGEESYFYTILDENGKVLQENQFIDFIGKSIKTYFKNEQLVFEIKDKKNNPKTIKKDLPRI